MARNLAGWFLLALVTLSLVYAGGLRYNYSPSVPLGFYVRTAEERGTFVEFCPPPGYGEMSMRRGYRVENFSCPDHGSSLLKRVAAKAGDYVIVSKDGLSVNGKPVPRSKALEHDSLGRKLSGFSLGWYKVAQGEIWVIGDDPRSFDSRYYGPVRLSAVRGYLRKL